MEIPYFSQRIELGGPVQKATVIYIYIYMYVYIYIYIHIYTCIHIYVYIYTYIHTYIQTYKLSCARSRARALSTRKHTSMGVPAAEVLYPPPHLTTKCHKQLESFVRQTTPPLESELHELSDSRRRAWFPFNSTNHGECGSWSQTTESVVRGVRGQLRLQGVRAP